MNKILLGVGAALSLAATSANAAIILTYDGLNFPGQISAQSQFTFTDQAGDVDLALALTNTSSIQSSITGFGFDLPDGSFVSFTFDQTNGWTLANNTNLPGAGIEDFDVCIQSDSNNNCAGNQVATGIGQGLTFNFGFLFNTTFTAAQFASVVLTEYSNTSNETSAVRFQGVGTNARDSDTAPNNPPTTSVPEPGTLALLGVGLLGLGLAMRRHRSMSEAAPAPSAVAAAA